jgi:CheY-like chemotaxis protein
MAPADRKILWVDDEIDLLKSHIIFLEDKGYDVVSATNGEDAISMVAKSKFDIMLLDESMPGMGGLETLNGIKDADPLLPVIMITKNEEEWLMEDAIGMKIDDYLLKPVSPLQIYSACKRILDARQIQEDRLTPVYIREFNEINALATEDSWDSWLKIHRRICSWDHEFDRFRNIGLESTHEEQRLNCSAKFSRFVESNYRDWIHSSERFPMSPDVFGAFVAPHLRAGRKTFLIVIDCVRLDQWMTMEPFLARYFDVQWDYYMSILPTATPYARNAIFSGMFPADIADRYPDKWLERRGDEASKNRYEDFLLAEQMKRLQLDHRKLKYVKLYTSGEAAEFKKKMQNLTDLPFVALVVNFVDILTHGRNQSEILQQLLPNEAAFRSLMRSWFTHSVLLELLIELAESDVRVVMTTDHGSILGRKSSMIYGRRDTSTNTRYKFGENLKCDEKQAIITRKPLEYRLPAESKTKNYVFAKEYYYFVYPTNFRDYQKQYEGSFQHGGVSLEEMILPCLTLTPKR